ncbi:MAG: hypothetical protein RQ966_04905 [Acetobacteraceae bacterium]|nr:hypothetical protein [Acetobacteraceae bacterium]
MSDHVENSAQPPLKDDMQELQGNFPNDAALQVAIGKLELAGFDHADLSLPDPTADASTPDSAGAATDNVDRTQLRVMNSGMAGTTAGFVAAGALIATGGVAAPVIAAVSGASALGTIAAYSGASNAVDAALAEQRDKLGAEGKLVLAVRTRSREMAAKAESVFRECGGTNLKAIVDANEAQTRGIGSAAWTG